MSRPSTEFIAFVIFPPLSLGFPHSVKMFCSGFQQSPFAVFHVKHSVKQPLHFSDLLLQRFDLFSENPVLLHLRLYIRYRIHGC